MMLLLRSFLFACLLSLVTANDDSDGFDLSDALGDDATQPRDDSDGFDLSDALGDDATEPQDDSDGFDLSDALGDDATEPQGEDDFDFNENPQGAADDSDGFDLSDALRDDTTQPRDNHDDFDLSDALRDDTTQSLGGNFDDSDLQDVIDSGYEPDKTNSKVQDPPAATDLITDLLMTLIGGTSEQFKKICFNILEMLNDLYNTQQEQ